MSEYKDMLESLKAKECSECHGLGMCDDAEPGDIGYNEWVCTFCQGKGYI
jgi:DnaJ-class molecular chaperone